MFEYATINVCTYNRPDALKRVLLELDQQTERSIEVVVADDGSSGETAETIASIKEQVRYPLRHVWQEDRGFRLARVRNLAVVRAEGDYVIFLDGDCIPPNDFVEAHRRLSEKGWWVRGSRVLLNEAFTARVLQQELPVARWPIWRWAIAQVRGDAARSTPFFLFRSPALRKLRPRKWQDAKGCNLGVWREDFFRIDGLDESYDGWGCEDSDLAIRLINSGKFRKEGRYAMPVVHLWHPGEDRSTYDTNHALLAETLKRGAVRARIGVSSHQA